MLAKFVEGKNEMLVLKDKYNRMRKKEDKDFIQMYKQYLELAKKVDSGRDELQMAG